MLVGAALVGWRFSGGALPWGGAPPTSRLTVTSDPAGAAATLDGATIGTTPLSVEATPGLHLLVVGSGPGARSHQVDVQAGVAATVHLALTAPAVAAAPAGGATATGALQVTTDPPGADVQVDGRAHGRSPVLIADLATGQHEVVVARAGRTLRRTVTVDGGATSDLVIALASPGIQSGWLTVTSPVPADILEGGVAVGRTDMPRLLLPVGAHDLEFVHAGLNYRERRTVQVTADRGAELTLPRVNGVLNVNAQPWAEVWVDGTRIGETPVGNYALPIGSHELVLRHPDLGERRQTISIGVGAPTRIGVDLRR